jgi:tRNA (cmo5U34)-methyltransferase
MDASPDFSVNDFFNTEKSLAYDQQIRMSLPGYEGMHEMVHAFLTDALPAEAHILVAGVGTGMELVTLGKRQPNWRFTAFDLSGEMLSACRSTVKKAGIEARVSLIEGKVDALPGDCRFDAATSLLVSHFIVDDTDRRQYFASIARRVRTHGLFLTADLVGDKSQPYFEQFGKAWRTFNIVNGCDAGELDENFKRSSQAVAFLPEEIYCGMLEESGFVDIRQFYRGMLFCGWVCRKG